MTIYLTGEKEEAVRLEKGAQEIMSRCGLPGAESGTLAVQIRRVKSEYPFLKVSGGEAPLIEYSDDRCFYRAVGLLIGDRNLQAEETACFRNCSCMVDMSRNAVYRVEEMKRLICFLALTGHDRIYLYMEDTYELPEYPYFGYLRGRYSLQELKELDDFAASMGVEAIPCIQTLAHLKTTLRWEYAREYKDTEDILLVGHEDTYRLIDAMFATLKKTFRSRHIHIGMDEAVELGTGNYLHREGFREQSELMLEHLGRVNELACRHGLIPMIWDDMFYRPLNAEHAYYDTTVRLSDEHIERVPPNVELVYWDYYHNTEKEYDELLAMRDRFPNKIVFAGGIWRWCGYVPCYSKTFVTTNAALAACKKHKVREIMSTCWGDDGSETPIETILPGLVLFGEHCFGRQVSIASFSSRCHALTGLYWEDFLAIEGLDVLPGMESPNLHTLNPSKHILFQDLLLGAFDSCFDREGIEEHYDEARRTLDGIAAKGGSFAQLFAMYAKLAEVLRRKARLGVRLRRAYRMNDSNELNSLSKGLPELIAAVEDFREAYADIWYRESKGHGFEVIDVRLGGLIGRLGTVRRRLELYLTGKIACIEELEEEILPFALAGCPEGPYYCLNKYRDIVSQNLLCQK